MQSQYTYKLSWFLHTNCKQSEKEIKIVSFIITLKEIKQGQHNLAKLM